MKKYLHIMSIELKNTFAYPGDTWLTAIFSVFSVVLAYLLWSAVFGELKTFNDFTLPQMVTYYLLSGIVLPLTESNGILYDFSEEIKNGSYSKYMVKPLSPLGYFLTLSFARALFPLLSTTVVLSAAMISFGGYFETLRFINVLKAIPMVFLGAVLSMTMGYIIAMATFKLTDIGFIFALQGIITSLLAGALIPLHMILGTGVAMWLPFSYTLYYPVMLCMGKSDIPLPQAMGIVSIWIVVLLGVGLLLQQRASKAFEGVGL